MGRLNRWAVLLALAFASGFGVWAAAQDSGRGNSVIRVEVNMVQLNVAVTDSKGNYVSGLHPSDFVISEDGLPQQPATFEEGIEAPQSLVAGAQGESDPKLTRRPPVATSGKADAT